MYVVQRRDVIVSFTLTYQLYLSLEAMAALQLLCSIDVVALSLGIWFHLIHFIYLLRYSTYSN